MNATSNISLGYRKRAATSWTTAFLGLALMALLNWSASAQLATDKTHGYAIDGVAPYTASGGGHSAQPGDAAIDLGMGGAALLTINDPAFLSALNAAAAGDRLTVSIWVQHYQISASSAFWFFSPSSSGNQRGFQAHVPWSDDTIYFDTAGCCDASLQRISAAISTFPGYTDDFTFWNAWRHFVFIKNGSNKQIWIDGSLFLAGSSSSPLPTDFNLVTVGSAIPAPASNPSIRGLIDDFAVFGAALSTNDVQAMFAGTKPDALPGASTNLLAYWDFNPAKPILSAVQAGPGATVTPDISAYFVIANASTAVQLSSIKLGINGADVTASATILPTNTPPLIQGSTAGATVYYVSPTLFAAGTTQTVSLVYSDNATPPNVYSNSWPVVIEAYNGYVTDAQGGHTGFLEGSAVFTLDKGGHTGKAGDRAIDLSGVGSGGAVHIGSANFLNLGAINGKLSVSFWMKLHQLTSGGAVFARSPSSSGGQRGFAVLPWNDDNIYFDTGGCCEVGTHRILASVTAMPTYLDDTWWTQWHHFAFSYDAMAKNIWIDGYQLDADFSSNPLPTDFRDLFFGYDVADNVYQQAIIDDVAVFASALLPASISALTNNVSPTTLPGETCLAYWDFNTLSPGPPFISLASTPAPNSTNSLPNVGANILIVNRNTQVQTNTITLAFDGTDVTSLATITSNSAGANVTFLSPALLAPRSTHRLTVVFSDNATPANVVSNSWTFAIGVYGGFAHDTLHNYLGMFSGNTRYTAVGGGHTGNPADRALDLGTDGLGGAAVTDPPFLNAANAAAGHDVLSVSFWLKQNPITASSAFWLNAPSVGRNFQAHCPYNSDVVYFDTAGCCSGTAQRISANINTFAPYADGGIGDGFWTNWHHFVFLKNGSDKQIWIDGQLFLEGNSTAQLATDMNAMYIGSAGSSSPRGQIDDFAIFGDALNPGQITQLAAQVPPTAVGATNLLAYWTFDDVGPAFVASRTPAPNATGVYAFGPNAQAVAVLYDGSTAVNTNTVRLAFNGTDVTSQTIITSSAPGVTQVKFNYAPTPTPLASGSTNVVTLLFNDTATPAANLTSNSWSFVAERYNGVTRDTLHGYLGLIWPSGHFTANGGGHSGQTGDYAMDLSTAGGAVHIDDVLFLRPAETNNILAFSFWCAKYDIASSSAFWVTSPSSSGTSRGFQTHLPWSNDSIYFDTAGCCDGALQRISAAISTFPDYANAGIGDGWWTNWHHYVFLYNAGDKQIWIDGQMFLEGTSTSPLPLDFSDMFIARDPADGYNMHGQMDDFAVFSSAVSPANIVLLAQGTLPTALTGETLLAYWNFNDVPVARPTITISATGKNVVITYTGTLQSAGAPAGPYSDMTGAPNPYTLTATGSPKFYRARQ